MMRPGYMTLLCLAVWFGANLLEAAEPRLISSDASGVVIEVHGMDYDLRELPDGRHRLVLPGGVVGSALGEPAVPVVGTLLGVPHGARVDLEIVEAEYDVVDDVQLIPSPSVVGRRAQYETDDAVYSIDAWFPEEPARLSRSGLLRDQQVQGVSLRPIQYNPVTRQLHVARRLRVRLAFTSPVTRPSLRPPLNERHFEPAYERSLLNASSSRSWRARAPRTPGKQALSWYDPNSDWYRLSVTEDGLYALDADWFESSGIDLSAADLTRLQIYYSGVEIPLQVEDGGDGTLDRGDRVLFWGTYRRVSGRDHESPFGRSRSYWLRFGTQAGSRYTDIDGTPVAGASTVPWVLQSVHSEVDSLYQRWGDAADTDRDHWVNVRTGSPSSEGNVEFPVISNIPLPHLDNTADVDATVRVGMHSLSLRPDIDPDHRARVEVQDGFPVTEVRWDGQDAFTAEGPVPASVLTDTTIVTLRTPGSPEFPFEPIPYVDHVHLNWITVTYPAATISENGIYVFATTALTDKAYEVGGFAEAPDFVLDVENGMLLSGAEPTSDGVRFSTSRTGKVVVVDDSAILTPEPAAADGASRLRTDLTGAAYVIITHGDFATQAEQLAEHRRSLGLTSMIVDVQDVFDEFNFGDVSEVAIQDFVRFAYENWSDRPAYLLLLGRMSYDYRDKFNEFRNGRTPRVPAMPFQSVRRGKAFTDHLYGTVAGDDPFMDVWVGRFSANRVRDAETVVSKAIAYDSVPDEPWRDRVTYLANWDDGAGPDLFIKDSDELISEYAGPLGLDASTIYHDAFTQPEPNESSSEVIRQFNEGRLIVNFMGHGSAASMSKYIAGTFQQRGFSYMSQIKNAEKLPLVIAMSCLNGLYDEPTLVCFAEEMTNKRDGGAIAFVSASSLAFIFVNNEVNQAMFRYMMREGIPEFGAALGLAKTDLLAAMPGIDNGVFMMNLMGDPAQRLALPEGSDYAVSTEGISIAPLGGHAADVLSTSDTARVTIHLTNDGIIDASSLDFVVIDRYLGTTDTVATGTVPAFGQADSAAVLWPLSGGVGIHQLQVILDPTSVLNEIRTDNNRAVVDVEVFGQLSAIASFPIESQIVSSNASLGVRTGITSDAATFGEFEVSQDPAFVTGPIHQSGTIQTASGLAIWSPGGLTDGRWYWRARMSDGSEAGAWTASRGFLVGQPGAARTVSWGQVAVQARELTDTDGIVTYADGTLGRTLDPLPLRITSAFREASITAEGVPATAILSTDGTFHYVKGFFSASAAYPDSETFFKVGSGYNGTSGGEVVGPISDPDIPTVSAAYHGDGFVYSDNAKAREIVRIHPSTGETTIIPVVAGLLEVRSGLVFDGHSLFTSDGLLIYNVANGVNGVSRIGWTVRVFDPEADWSIVREFTVDPTSTGFSFAFTDGVLADGEYLYLIEFGTGSTHRVRVIDAVDGSFIEEYQSDQAETDLLSGQYDWTNNKVWFGQLNGNQIHRYAGRRLPDEGILLSSPIGPATAWKTVEVVVDGDAQNASVDLMGEGPNGVLLPIAEWSDLPAGTVDLAELDPAIDRIRLRLRLTGPELERSPGMQSWRVNYQPVTDMSIANLEVSATEVMELDRVILSVNVLNRGPIDEALGAVIAFYAGPPEEGRIIGRQAVPENTPIGQPRQVQFAWITAQFAGTHVVHARVEDLFGNEAFHRARLVAGAPIEIRASSDASLPAIEIRALDATGEVRTGDYLPSQTAFLITISDSSGIDGSTIEINLTTADGILPTVGVGSNLVSQLSILPTSTSFQYAPPSFEDGTHSLEVRANDRVGNGPATKQISFEVTSDLRLERVLNYPNPMATSTDFTFLMSRPSEVTIKIFTLSGRLVRLIDVPSGRAGYNQIHWDGLDSQGRTIANGTYIYTVSAGDGMNSVREKETLIVYR